MIRWQVMDEKALLQALRDGDQAVFANLVDIYSGPLLRVAMMYVPGRAVAEEVVQETWLGFLESLDRFEGRSSLKTWLFRILLNTAKKRGGRERRSIPFSATWRPDPGEPAVDPSRFRGDDDRWPGHWLESPPDWDTLPEQKLLSDETLRHVQAAIRDLPPAQREVITLRDVDGWSSREVCNVLGLTETNQRVLLHRARSKVRRAVERYVDLELESA
jgi:RNA polymerase sigma-70 factor (ECF subfamily)